LFLAHKLHFSHIVLLTWRAWGQAVPRWVSSFRNCLTNVGASDSVNFHHLSVRKFSPSVPN
jgi:hypothetical protein